LYFPRLIMWRRFWEIIIGGKARGKETTKKTKT
jgi:hypothetical protein